MHIFASGFGPFHGVDDNPTTKLMEALQNSVEFIGTCTVFTTSVEAVDVSLNDWTRTVDGQALFVHLGVKSKASSFHIETSAYNSGYFNRASTNLSV